MLGLIVVPAISILMALSSSKRQDEPSEGLIERLTEETELGAGLYTVRGALDQAFYFLTNDLLPDLSPKPASSSSQASRTISSTGPGSPSPVSQ